MINSCTEVIMSPFVATTDNTKLYLTLISFSLALISLFMMKLNISIGRKIILMYSHIAFLMFPFVVYATHTTCGYLCFSCYSNPATLISLALPTTILFSTLVSLVTIPFILIKINGSRKLKVRWITEFINKNSEMLGIKKLKIYAIDKPNPVAFSFKTFKSAIFLSIGVLDTFNKKELEAVLLHELMHIKRSSSLLKFSHTIFQIFSPISILANFDHNSSNEEKLADEFATKIQRTNKHLLSAKKKFKLFVIR